MAITTTTPNAGNAEQPRPTLTRYGAPMGQIDGHMWATPAGGESALREKRLLAAIRSTGREMSVNRNGQYVIHDFKRFITCDTMWELEQAMSTQLGLDIKEVMSAAAAPPHAFGAQQGRRVTADKDFNMTDGDRFPPFPPFIP